MLRKHTGEKLFNHTVRQQNESTISLLHNFQSRHLDYQAFTAFCFSELTHAEQDYRFLNYPAEQVKTKIKVFEILKLPW